jgi:hypothetical protein
LGLPQSHRTLHTQLDTFHHPEVHLAAWDEWHGREPRTNCLVYSLHRAQYGVE